MSEGTGLRYNQGKPRYDLVHTWAHEQMVNVLTAGAKKYAPRNWEGGMEWSKVLASLKRHLAAIENGEDFDKETGELHAAHLACNAHFLTAYYKIFPQGDDRVQWYKTPFKKIYLDLDGVLVDFETSFLEYFNLPDYPPTDWNDWRFKDNMYLTKDNDDFWLNCKRLIKPEDIVYPITGYCTSRPCSDKIILEWLKKNDFPICEIINVGFNTTKVQALKGKCDIFLDDSIKNFIELNSEGITTYLMSRPHNKKYKVGHLRVNNISEFFSNIC